jgi:hypothetical protein
MSNFRIKKTPKTHHNMKSANTLENKHRQTVKMMENKKHSINSINTSLNKINEELFKIDKMREKNIVYDLNKRAELLNSKKNLEEELENLSNNMDEINYYDMTGDLLTEYYTIRETTTHIETKNIFEYLKKPESAKQLNSTTKAVLFDKYCQRIEGIRVNKDDGTNRIKYCADCDIEKTLVVEESSYICSQCGNMEFVIIDEDKQIKEYSPYRRINHYKEWLNQLQAKEITDITSEVYENIVHEINKYKNLSINNIDRNRMQEILKKLGYNKLYEHIPFILNKLIGIEPPKINRETEEKLIEMFTMVQELWDIYKPKGRKNFISYPYVLYKCSELLELDDLLVYYPMLQPPKIIEHDAIWQKFCKYLKWEFYPTT